MLFYSEFITLLVIWFVISLWTRRLTILKGIHDE
jgi:hypothetical protein